MRGASLLTGLLFLVVGFVCALDAEAQFTTGTGGAERISTMTAPPVEREELRAEEEWRLTQMDLEELRPWWSDLFSLRMSASSVLSTGTWSEHPSNRFSAHRGAGYRVQTAATLTPPEPMARYERGPWSVYGGVSVTSYYTNNMFLTPQNEESGLVLMVTPQAGVTWTQSNYSADVRYGATGYHSRFDEFQRLEHQVSTDFSATIRQDLRATVGNTYGMRTIAPGGKDMDYGKYYDNETRANLVYNPWEDWAVDVGYDRYQARFHDPHTDNTTINAGSVLVSRRVAPAVWAQGHLRYEHTENHDDGALNSDNQTYTGSVGVMFEPTAAVTGNVHMGYIDKNFDESAIDDEGTLYLNAQIIYSPREYLQLFWAAARSLYETSFSAMNAPDGPVFTGTSTSIGAEWDVADLWGVGVLWFYARDKYAWGGPAREDELYGGRASVYYEINPLARLVVAYQYQTNDSNHSANDYDENYASVGLDVSF